MRRNKYLTILLATFSFALFSQETQIISLSELIELSEQNNLTVKISESEVEASKGEYIQSGAAIFPKISISHTGLSTNNPLMTFGTKLNQEIVTQSDFNPMQLNNPSTIKNFSTKIEIIQPLFNADGLHMRKAAKAKMNAMKHKSSRAINAIKLEITKAYMELQLAYKIIAVLEKSEMLAAAHKMVATDYYDQGYLQKSDLLSVDVYLTDIKNKNIQAKTNLKNVSDYIHFLIGSTSINLFKPAEELKESNNLISSNSTLNESRSDIQAIKNKMEAYKFMYKSAKTGYLPRFNAFGSYELYDSQLFNGSAKGYMVGAQLSWNVFEGFLRVGRIKKSKSEYNNAKLQLEEYINQSQLELNKANRQLIDAKNSVKLSNLSVEQSSEVLRIRTDRFKEGLEKTTDLLAAETTHLNKQFEALQAVFQYNFTKAYINFLTK